MSGGEAESSVLAAQVLEPIYESAGEWDRVIAVYEVMQAQAEDVTRRVELLGRMAEIEERLFLLSRLCRKHGRTVADLAARRDALAAELAEVARYDDVLAERQAAADAANARAVAAAAALTASRKQAALSLEKKVSATLRELGFATARLPVVLFEARDLGAAGADRVRFLFAPNPGEASKPLRAIASSGELARVMLALKTVLALEDRIPVLVLDEVDANVGGETATAVGEKMQRIGRKRQVLAIRDLTVRYGGVTAVSHVSLDVRHGSITGLIGPNGAGKTTLLDAVSGAVPGDGEVVLNGTSLARLRSSKTRCRPGRSACSPQYLL